MALLNRRPGRISLFAGVLLVIFFLQSLFASLRKSPVYDEPPHIAAGLSYVQKGVFHANLQHPPLLKEISGLFLSLAGIRWPKSPSAQILVGGAWQGQNLEWQVGNEIIAANSPNYVLFWARLPFILIATLMGGLIFIWGRQLVGDKAALCALFIYVFDPNILGHSYLVTTDVGFAAFTVLFLFVLWNYLQRPSRKRMLLCGLALGAVLASKFSAVVIIPIGLVLLWLAPRRAAAAGEMKVGPNSPCPCGSGKKFKKCHGEVTTSVSPLRNGAHSPAVASALILAAAAGVICLLYFFNPLLYLDGIRLVNADHTAGYKAYIHGALAPRFLSYFAVAYLLKEPIPSIALAIWGAFILWRDRSATLSKKLFLLLPPITMFLGYSLTADDLGVRYIIPVLPFAFLLAGIAAAKLITKSPVWARYVAVALCFWLVVPAIAVFPDNLSYFNETACLLEDPGKIGFDGGSRCGTLWLDDSNVDWGQGLKQLRDWQDRHASGRMLRLSTFSPFPPQAYGIRYQTAAATELLQDPAPGLYAVSAHLVALVPVLYASMHPGQVNWLRRVPPSAIVGHAFYIFDIPEPTSGR